MTSSYAATSGATSTILNVRERALVAAENAAARCRTRPPPSSRGHLLLEELRQCRHVAASLAEPWKLDSRDGDPVDRSSRNRPACTSCSRSRRVAAMMRTSTAIHRFPPTRRVSPVASEALRCRWTFSGSAGAVANLVEPAPVGSRERNAPRGRRASPPPLRRTPFQLGEFGGVQPEGHMKNAEGDHPIYGKRRPHGWPRSRVSGARRPSRRRRRGWLGTTPYLLRARTRSRKSASTKS